MSTDQDPPSDKAPKKSTAPSKNTGIDEDSKQRWCDLDEIQKEKINKYVRKSVRLNVKESNSYDSKLYNWCFILNAGGLVGTGTLLTISSKDAQFVNLCIFMMFCFIAGIISLIIAAKLEISRYRKDSDRILKEKSLFRENHTSYSYFKNKVEEDTYPFQITENFEKFSLGIFFLATLVGLLFLIFNSESICERKQRNQIYPCFECEDLHKKNDTNLKSVNL